MPWQYSVCKQALVQGDTDNHQPGRYFHWKGGGGYMKDMAQACNRGNTKQFTNSNVTSEAACPGTSRSRVVSTSLSSSSTHAVTGCQTTFNYTLVQGLTHHSIPKAVFSVAHSAPHQELPSAAHCVLTEAAAPCEHELCKALHMHTGSTHTPRQKQTGAHASIVRRVLEEQHRARIQQLQS